MRDEQTLREEFKDWKWPRDHGLLANAVRSGPVGTEILAELMRSQANPNARTIVAGYLGEAKGDGGIPELREAIRATGAVSQDLKCAAIVALTKRLHNEATPDMVVALGDRNGAVRGYAMTCLAFQGDERGCDAVLAEVERRVKRGASAIRAFPIGDAIAYVVRVGSAEQRQRLAATMAPHWSKLVEYTREWVGQFWPPVEIDGEMSYTARRASRAKVAQVLKKERSVLSMKPPDLL
jgi:hypothetical protein